MVDIFKEGKNLTVRIESTDKEIIEIKGCLRVSFIPGFAVFERIANGVEITILFSKGNIDRMDIFEEK